MNLENTINKDCPLCVDLDGTLSKTDTLMEALFLLLKINPLYVFMLPIWLSHGKAHLKHEIAIRVDLETDLLPFRQHLVDYLRGQAAEGRTLVLATAANHKIAQKVADHFGFFAEVLSSDAQTNLSRENKAKALVGRFGENQFVYLGNDHADLPVWKHAQQAVLVNAPKSVKRSAESLPEVVHVDDDPKAGLLPYIKAIRLHQWLKNLLLFVPLIAAHEINNPVLLGKVILAFFSFGFCASSVYLLNDLLDLGADRAHPRKRHRPFAAGTLSLVHGTLMIPSFFIVSVLLALLVSPLFLATLLFYFTVTLAYSFKLKKMVLVDVFLLAGLYTLRIIGGSAAVATELSFWLLAFSIFLFLSLALVKRCAELVSFRKKGKQKARGRGYYIEDIENLPAMGVASGYLSVLVVALFINSPDVLEGYHKPYYLWTICPIMLYWVSRMWLKTGRGEMHDDPIVFAVKDRQSLVLGGIIGLSLILAL